MTELLVVDRLPGCRTSRQVLQELLLQWCHVPLVWCEGRRARCCFSGFMGMMGQNTDEHSLFSGHHSHCCAIRSVISCDCSRAALPRRSSFSARGRATPLLRATMRRRIEVSECIFGNSFFFSFLLHFFVDGEGENCDSLPSRRPFTVCARTTVWMCSVQGFR